VIQSLVGDWNAVDFENEYRRDLRAMLDAKLAGQAPVRPEPAEEAPVVDLMEALRRSVAEAQERRGGEAKPARGSRAKAAGGRKAPARKSA